VRTTLVDHASEAVGEAMVKGGDGRPRARTLLEVKIRERNLTLDEFAAYSETYARENGESGTLSTRHLQRLIAPRPGTSPPVLRPATRRLLERIFDTPIAELLGSPVADHSWAYSNVDDWERSAADLNRRLTMAERVDPGTIDLLAAHIDTTRQLDRRLGAATLLNALRQHAEHIEDLFTHCTNDETRRALAAVLTDAHTLAGWQSLDRGEVAKAWEHYRRACDAARAADSSALLAHALAEQAVVLADVGRTTDSAAMSAHARRLGQDAPPLLRSWLAAAHGEALAADDQPKASLHAFDTAHDLLRGAPDNLGNGPYLALDAAHLARWRGHALARFGRPDAATVLRDALDQHDAEFTRAEAGLRTDLVMAYVALGERDAARHEVVAARRTADAVDSARQHHRIAQAVAALAS
jgi:hypothetical protein